MEKSLVEIAEVKALENTQAQTILDNFKGFFEQAKEWESKALSINITDENQTVDMKEAREARLALKAIRVNAENVRKDLKEKSLREGKAIDGVANVIKALIVPIEEHLEKQEKFVEILASERKEKLNSERVAALQPYVMDVALFNLKEMSEEGFQQLLTSSKIAVEAQKAELEKAERERLDREKADAEERERVRAENEQLKKDAEAREKALAKERAEQEKKLASERAKARAESEAREKALAKERAEQEKKLASERAKARAESEAREKAETALKEKAGADARREREAREQAEREKSERDRLGKEERYKSFLKENNYNEKSKHLFHVEKVGNEVRLFKIIGTFNID